MPAAKPHGAASAAGKTSLAKPPARVTGRRGRSKAAERPGRGGPSTPRMLPKSAASATVSGDGGNCPSRQGGRGGGNALRAGASARSSLAPLYVPVVSASGRPLMSCHPARARELARRGRALRRFSKGVFYVHLLDRADGACQPVACGIDPGSTREAFTVASASRTYINVDADAVTHVGRAVEVRKQMRRARRYRTAPCRPPRANRGRGGIPPSTRARWGWKLRVVDWFRRLYPISVFVVEDIKAATRGQRRWDASFSPLEVGKQSFYAELRTRGTLVTRDGWETHALRTALGLPKTGDKRAETFWAHCVDSWTLAASAVGGASPDTTAVLRLAPTRLHRRQLHRLQPAPGGLRRPYGGTRSLGLKRGSLALHPRWGLASVGGTTGARISLHSLATGARLTQRAHPGECVALTWNAWRLRLLPGLKSGVSGARENL